MAKKKTFSERLKSIPWFYRIYFAVFAVLFILLFVGLSVLSNVLRDYEASLPIHRAEAAFERYFAGGDFTELVRFSHAEVSRWENEDDVAAMIAQAAEGKTLSFYEVSSAENEAKYAVVATEPQEEEEPAETTGVQVSVPTYKLATMTFQQNKEPDEWGFYSYELVDISLDLTGNQKAAARIPSEYQLYVNGIAVPKEEHVEEEASPLNEFLPEGVTGITYYSYEFSGLCQPAVLTCADASGNAIEMAEEEGVSTAPIRYSEELKERYSDYVLKGAKAYAAWMQADGSINDVAPYFDTSSQFYRNTRANPGMWVIDHDSYTFENVSAEDFYAYDDNTFSCHITMTQVLKKYGKQDYHDYLNMTFFLRKVNGQFKIYDRMIDKGETK